MNTPSPLLDELIKALTTLPSVGNKSAQRMAYHLLERDRQGAAQLAHTITTALEKIGHCQQCRTLCEFDLCALCSSPKRDQSLLCVVEMPIDVMVIERASAFNGVYFVLLGKLSPLDGITPADLGLDLLAKRLASGAIRELILATNPSVEGEATAYYISEMARKFHVHISRIAHGVPIGGELEYIDGSTLNHAFAKRTSV